MKELEALAAAVERMKTDRDHAEDTERLKQFEGLLAEISTALADVVVVLEKPEKERDNSELIAAIRSIQMTAEAPKITVDTAPVTINNQIDVQPTPFQINVPEAKAAEIRIDNGQSVGSKWEIKIPGTHGSAARTMTITRTA